MCEDSKAGADTILVLHNLHDFVHLLVLHIFVYFCTHPMKIGVFTKQMCTL